MPQLKVYHPLPRFPALSLSGTACELHCQHCTATYLAGMMPVTTPDALLAAGRRLRERGALGVLLSGGSTRDGAILNLKPMAPAIQRLKAETGLLINLHPGLLDKDTAAALAGAVDFASLEIPSTATVREVFGLDATTADYRTTYEWLRTVGIPVIPHVTLYDGTEAALLEGLASPETVVVIVFSPTPGTPMEAAPPPTPKMLRAVFQQIRASFPETELSLGCMRPRRPGLRSALEMAALEAGATRMELPAGSTLEAARVLGYRIVHYDACCALPRRFESELPSPISTS